MKIVVQIIGGNLSSIHSSNPDIGVIVYDWDNIKNDPAYNLQGEIMNCTNDIQGLTEIL